jgi:hypothetical protein
MPAALRATPAAPGTPGGTSPRVRRIIVAIAETDRDQILPGCDRLLSAPDNLMAHRFV